MTGEAANAGMETPPLSLYVHLPWCVRKCPYCDFNSHRAGAEPPRDRYIDALISDLRAEAVRAGDRPLVSVFLGGGTPSVFSGQQIQRLLDAARALFPVAADAEITMEINPGTSECDEVRGYVKAGVNRFSIGAQSFSDPALQALGRIHSSADIDRAVAEARAAGVNNLNLDLMHALPEQSVEGAVADLRAAISLGPEHISWYQLTLEPNTVFFAKPPAGLPDDELADDIREAGQAVLAAHGYRQYEVSAFAKDAWHCRHNLNYWTFGDYAAVGAGAHGKLTLADGVFRYAKPANPQQYMECMETGRNGEVQRIDSSDRLFEFMLNALRLNDGFTEAAFERRTGLPPGELRERLTRLSERQLVEEIKPGSWRASGLGRRFLNDLQAEFLP